MVGAALVAAACSDGAAPAGSARCPAAASLPLTARHVFGPPPSEDFTFDGDGYLLALDSGRSLVRVARESVPMLVAPNVVANGRGLRVLAAGDVVIADQDRSLLVRVDPAGNPRRLTTTIANPNGLALGPGGTLWATDFGVTGDVHRVDADSGEATALARPAKGSNGLVFSPDYRLLYVGDHDAGVIYRLPLLPDGRLGAAERWAEGLGKPDGLAVDACGNVYVASWDRRVYQVNPAGEVRVLAELTEHGVGGGVRLGQTRAGRRTACTPPPCKRAACSRSTSARPRPRAAMKGVRWPRGGAAEQAPPSPATLSGAAAGGEPAGGGRGLPALPAGAEGRGVPGGAGRALHGRERRHRRGGGAGGRARGDRRGGRLPAAAPAPAGLLPGVRRGHDLRRWRALPALPRQPRCGHGGGEGAALPGADAAGSDRPPVLEHHVASPGIHPGGLDSPGRDRAPRARRFRWWGGAWPRSRSTRRRCGCEPDQALRVSWQAASRARPGCSWISTSTSTASRP